MRFRLCHDDEDCNRIPDTRTSGVFRRAAGDLCGSLERGGAGVDSTTLTGKD